MAGHPGRAGVDGEHELSEATITPLRIAAEKSSSRKTGLAPVKFTLPVMVPPFASSATWPGSLEAGLSFLVSSLDRPQPQTTKKPATQHASKLFCIFNSIRLQSYFGEP